MRDSTSRPSSFGQNSCSAWRICSEPTKRWGKCARVDHCPDARWLPLVETTELSTQSVTDRELCTSRRSCSLLARAGHRLTHEQQQFSIVLSDSTQQPAKPSEQARLNTPRAVTF